MNSKNYKILSYLSLGLGFFSLYKLWKTTKTTTEQTSSFLGDGEQKIVFTLTNNTNQNQVQYLFDSYSEQNNPNVGVVGKLKFFNRELLNNPKKVSRIEFRALNNSGFSGADGDGIITPVPPAIVPVPISPERPMPVRGFTGLSTPIAPTPATPTPVAPTPVVAPVSNPIPSPITQPSSPVNNQAEAPFKMNCKDANGNASVQQFIPLISSAQFQKGITSVDMGGMVLDGECFMEYTMYPNSKVAIVVYYENFPLSKQLTKNKKG